GEKEATKNSVARSAAFSKPEKPRFNPKRPSKFSPSWKRRTKASARVVDRLDWPTCSRKPKPKQKAGWRGENVKAPVLHCSAQLARTFHSALGVPLRRFPPRPAASGRKSV